jgi:maltose-binding protein MalE
MYFIVVPAAPEAGAKTFLSLLATAGACCIITTGAWAIDNYRDKK